MYMDPREPETRRFLRELGKGIPEDERVMVCYKTEVNKQTNDGEKDRWPVETYREDKSLRTTQNAYVAISSSKKTLNKYGKMHYWRGTASFGHGMAIMVDDIGDGIGSKGGFLLTDVMETLLPSAIVETSPGNYQVWYFLDKPEESMPKFKAFLLSFVEEVLEGAGGDSTIRDVSRLGRLPIGINNKRLPDGTLKYGEDCQVRLIGMDNPPLRYSMEKIAEAFKFTIKEPVEVRRRAATTIDKEWFNIAVTVLDTVKMGEGNGGRMFSTDGRYRIQCPWAREHGTGNPFGAYIWSDDYADSEHPFVFGCAHHACKGRGWTAFVDEMVMPMVEGLIEAANSTALDDPKEYKRVTKQKAVEP
jgi:RepB DNA-primase from phage plasmid